MILSTRSPGNNSRLVRSGGSPFVVAGRAAAGAETIPAIAAEETVARVKRLRALC